MTIKDVSVQTGLSAKAIRFYEQIQLIAAPRRSANGYRSYSPQVIEDLKMVKYARDLGLPIPQIKTLINGCRDGGCRHNQEYLQKEIASFQSQLAQKISQMQQLDDQLNRLKSALSNPSSCDPQSQHCCNILHQLTQIQKGGVS